MLRTREAHGPSSGSATSSSEFPKARMEASGNTTMSAPPALALRACCSRMDKIAGQVPAADDLSQRNPHCAPPFDVSSSMQPRVAAIR